MKYKVLVLFSDLQDGDHVYNVGDEYPRKGLAPSDARIAELSGKENLLGRALIEEVKEDAKPAKKETKAAKKPAKKEKTEE